MIRPLYDSPFEPGESLMEISHQLPMAAYHAMERWHPERIGALALYCSDGRWGEAFDEFCHRHLQIPHYDRWAAPGGPAWVNAPPGTEYFKATRTQLDFLVRAHGLERIVLITHFGCAWYGHLLKRPVEECLTEQVKDVQKAAGTLAGWYPGLTVEAYLAMRTRDWLSFHRIDAPHGARSW
jgi:hypothetical protein